MVLWNRRNFLKASAAVIAAPYIVPSTCFGANERITIGCIGVRNQGTGNLKRFLGAGCNVAAICDVDSEVRAKAMPLVREKGGRADEFGDYRHLLERKDLDAVVITVPDHWHALMTIHACQAGKDVYCEKPLSLSIAEGRRMVNAARENKRIVQTGSQQRSSEEFWKAATLIRNGAIGKLEQVLVGIPKTNHPGPLGPDTPAPANLDYDMWLGPAPLRPYNEKRVHYNFRFWWDYSGGQITNFGAHHLDITQWALGMDDSGPSACEGTATFDANHLYEVTETCRLTYTYPNDVRVTLGQLQKDIPSGVTFIGSGGTIYVNRGKLKSEPGEVIEKTIEDLPIQLARSKNHTQNFLDSIKSRELPICDVEIGHRSATVCHLGNMVARLGRGVKWDPRAERIVGDDQAQQMVERPYREPWTHEMRFSV
jgi:predicted dehydrogenase